MLSILFKLGKKETLEDKVLAIQKGDTVLQNELINQYKPFIAKTVSQVCKRYINEQDDEFSIGLMAFHESIEKYSTEKGSSLLSFAELIIKRRVIDFIRKESKQHSVKLDTNVDDEESIQNKYEVKVSVEDFQKKLEQDHRKDEILHYQTILKQFDLTFQDLVEQSPKHADARENAMKVAYTVIQNPNFKKVLFEKKRLPIKDLEKHVDVSRKTIERNRKYIIAVCIIMASEYVYLKEYVKGVMNH
ncbi:RNA polymerase sigma factor SigI [Bacillus suaedaesalsae]|uniref:RNA polymerase sigma factor SigI n=1 Tax=Bacillus suaedaesalsae TaxID=2810349 RepID=A0ABS2DI44_9BACI|nr:RNA polymerase sigma factor SigI [Bacillus suaedaesalsae]MBM6618119.1 RNA polymerase sigma factor SigI [Bacillus suaedaesalsae]